MNQEQIQAFHALHHEAVVISQNLLRQEFLMLEILQQIDGKKVYRFLGFKSLFQYATVALKLTPDRAYSFILVSRKARGLSKMQEALKDGSLSLSKAKRISSVIQKDNEDHWLKVAKVSTQRSLERAVAKENPKSSIEEGSRFVSEAMLEFRAAVSADTDQLIRRVQDVESQSRGRAATWEETLREAAKAYLDAKDPVIKAQRILKKKMKSKSKEAEAAVTKESDCTARPVAFKNKSQDLFFRKHVLSELKHSVYLRDQGKCQVRGCGDSRWIDIHHVKPVSEGGENILENLVTLCRSHHQMEHWQQHN